jgi:selenocysteine-specific elongation factor
MKSAIVGTAGHIDHGKTALVRALTGIDADRLEEEKRRGITIDLGFAHLDLLAPGGEVLRIGFVDVPGHERFVRNMLAGVGGIDLVLLVIAADESIKPQTREHFDICRLLSVRRGITVLTKSDLVDPETLEVVQLEVEDFLRGSFLDVSQSPIVPVSSLTGAGVAELKNALIRAAAEVPAKDSAAITRLPIDRVFTMKGFGTVVTGTLIAGSIRKEDELEVFPSGKHVRVRGIQVHGQPAESALAGQRTALNLGGVSQQDLARGMILAPPDTFRRTGTIDVQLTLLPSARPLKNRDRTHFHVYTSQTIATPRLFGAETRLQPGKTAFAKLKLEKPQLLLPGDRFILRQFSPVVTVGGGVVLDAHPAKPIPRGGDFAFASFLPVILDGRPEEVLLRRIARRLSCGLTVSEAIAETGWTRTAIEAIAKSLIEIKSAVRLGDLLVDRKHYDSLKTGVPAWVAAEIEKHRLDGGISKGELRSVIPNAVLDPLLVELVKEGKLEVRGDLICLPGRNVVMRDDEAKAKELIEAAFSSAGLAVPALRDVLTGLSVDKAHAQKIVTLLLRDRILVKISDDLVFHRDALLKLRTMMAAEKATRPKIDVSRFKDLTGVSRKYAIPLLEYLDRERVTRRVGNERVIL